MNTKLVTGTLYIVATPLGNLRDMTLRAVDVLQSVDYIAAEDTRHSRPLLQNFSINTPMFALHEHNERERAEQIIDHLLQGKSIALISDAGTPLISDPGYFLTREVRKRGLAVVPVPGASAVITALSVSGLPTDRFCFEGFLPQKSKQRQSALMLLRDEARTMVFYESPHRILACLQDMESVFGSEREAVIARELTKKFETILSGSLFELVARVEQDANQQLGEFVVMVKGALPTAPSEDNADDVLDVLLESLPLKQAVSVAAKLLPKRKKNELYRMALERSKK